MPRNFIRGSSPAYWKWILILFALILTSVRQPSAQNTAFDASPATVPDPEQGNGIIRLAIPELEGTYLYRFSVLKLNPPRGKPRGIFTERMKIDFQFAH